MPNILRLGPVGGTWGSPFTTPQDLTIRSIVVRTDSYVNSLSILLSDGNQYHYGGQESENEHKITLEDGEHLTGVFGRYGSYIDSLGFVSNKRTFGPFGGSGGASDFQLTLTDSLEIVGFFGRSGNYLDALGIIARG
jgi:hypothetical protein